MYLDIYNLIIIYIILFRELIEFHIQFHFISITISESTKHFESRKIAIFFKIDFF